MWEFLESKWICLLSSVESILAPQSPAVTGSPFAASAVILLIMVYRWFSNIMSLASWSFLGLCFPFTSLLWGGISHAVSILLSIRFYTLLCIISIQDWHCCTSSLFFKIISVMFWVFSLVPRPVNDTEKWVTRSQLSYNFCFTSSLSLFLASRLCAS